MFSFPFVTMGCAEPGTKPGKGWKERWEGRKAARREGSFGSKDLLISLLSFFLVLLNGHHILPIILLSSVLSEFSLFTYSDLSSQCLPRDSIIFISSVSQLRQAVMPVAA